jgi:hypothetical protein
VVLEYLEKNYPLIDFRKGAKEGHFEDFATHPGLITPHVSAALLRLVSSFA